jgi:succinate-acetate transporter protein
MAQATETKTETAAAVANPAPLGLFAFATTTLVLSAANAHFTGVNPGGAVTMALAYGGLGQLLAGMWEFRAGNTFGAAAFTTFGGFWISYWAYFTFSGNHDLLTAVDKAGAATGNNDLGWYLLGWTVVTFLFFLGTLRQNFGLVVVFGLLTLTFLLLCIGEFNPPAAGETASPIAGYFGFATAIAAYYVGLAGIMTATNGRFKLPLGQMR